LCIDLNFANPLQTMTKAASKKGAAAGAAPKAPKALRDTALDPKRPSIASLPDSAVESLLLRAVPLGGQTVGPLLLVSRRFWAVARNSGALWRAVLASSGYVPSRWLPDAYLKPRMQAAPAATVAALLKTKCEYCGTGSGTYFFTLHHCRICKACFEAGPKGNRDPKASYEDSYPKTKLEMFLPADSSAGGASMPSHRVPKCAFFSKGLAKTTFLVVRLPCARIVCSASEPSRPQTDTQLGAMPTISLTGDAAKRAGFVISSDAKLTLVTSGDCLNAAVERFGSVAGLRAEVAARLDKAETARAAASAAHSAEVKRRELDGVPSHVLFKHPPPNLKGKKDTTNFSHLNQACGLFTGDPDFGCYHCPPRAPGGGGGAASAMGWGSGM
jgi:hypothetical protein